MTDTWRRRAAPVAVASGLLLATACGRHPPAPPADPLMDVFRRHTQEEGLTRAQTAGKRLFAHSCVTCHGEHGDGNGQNAFNLDPKPPNFRDSLAAHPPSYWRQIIEGGSAAVGRSPLCPPRGRTLGRDDIDALIAYLQVLAAPPTPPGSAPPRPAEPR